MICAKGIPSDSARSKNALVPSHCYRMRVFGLDLIRGGHYGHRSCEPHLKGRTHGCTDQPCKREESSCQLGAVHTWHIASIPVCPLSGRYWRVISTDRRNTLS